MRYFQLFVLILAGETIFCLPFHVTRFFRPAFLEVFGFTNGELGDVVASYGVVAMVAYFPSGALADRFSPRVLISLSLVATAAGGPYLLTIPSATGLAWLFAYWGATTILFLWAALIRATREWGGSLTQGQAFGLLEGGRGLVAAGLGSLAVFLWQIPFGPEDMATAEASALALQRVIGFYTLVTLLAGIVCWFALPQDQADVSRERFAGWEPIRETLRDGAVWMHALIVVMAYCAGKGLDNYALYAQDVAGMDPVQAAHFVADAAYLRPIAAIAAGLVADRLGHLRILAGLFLGLILAYGALMKLSASANWLFLAGNLYVSFAAVYGLRGVYFTLLETARIPSHRTGIAIGLVSVIGFTPDVFFASLTGRMLDAAPGVSGYENYFFCLSGFAALGLTATLLLAWILYPRRFSRKAQPDCMEPER